MAVQVRDFVVEAMCGLPQDCLATAVTSDGHVVAFWDQPDGRVRFAWDGMAGEPFDRLGELRDKSPSIFASEDGQHVAYVGVRRGCGVFVGRDDTEDPAIEAFSRSVPPVFSRGGRHLAYGGGTVDDFRLILDGRATSEFPIAAIPVLFSPDGERLLYAEVQGEGGTMAEARTVLDGVPGGWLAVTDNSASASRFSPDSRRLASGRFDGNGPARWLVDGVPQQVDEAAGRIGFERVRTPGEGEPPLIARFSPDSRRFVYLAHAPGRGVAVIEHGVARPLVRAIGDLVFSPDSLHLAYLAETLEGGYTLVLDGISGPSWPAKEGGGPVFSPDSRHTAFIVRRDEGSFLRRRRLYTLVVDRRAVAERQGDDAATPSFSPDGEHVAWMGMFGEGVRPVLDDRVGPAFELPLAWSFDADGVATWYAQRGDVVYRVTAQG